VGRGRTQAVARSQGRRGTAYSRYRALNRKGKAQDSGGHRDSPANSQASLATIARSSRGAVASSRGAAVSIKLA